ncbi:MAG: acetate--CoA ligase family protein, partial [Rhodospirillaceae bacterium]|nr:acetate--CoA ligase family protein [Rhodospirillaceae bacterium]
MNIHEYQAKELMRKYGIAVPDGGVAWTPEEAVKQAGKLGGPVWVVKSQIHAGGRGAGHFRNDPHGKGGVRVVTSIEDVRANAEAMLGRILVTNQTGSQGKEVKRLYIEDGCDIAREFYLSVLLDRTTSRITVMASIEGGMDIETVARETPEKIIRVGIDPATGIQRHHCRSIAFGLRLAGPQVKSATRFLMAMYKAFCELDASLVEINPLVVTGSGEVIALDAKMNFDDNALYRH